MPRTPGRALICLAAALLALIAAAHSLDAAPPLDRRLRLNLWGAGLADVAVAVKEATGVDIVYYLPDLPSDQNTDTVHLVTGEVPLSTVLETLARRFGFRFRVASDSGAGRVELSRGYGWAPPEPGLRFAQLPSGLSARESTPEAEREFFNELLRVLPLLDSEFTLRVEAYPLPGRPGAMRATAALPQELAEYFAKTADCLSGSGGDYPGGAAAGGQFSARARDNATDWEALLTRQVENPDSGDLRALLADVADQAGVAIALTAPPAAAEAGRLPPDAYSFTLGMLCEALSEEYGLGKRVFLASGGVVFERGAETGIEMDGRSRELFWGGLAVAGFDAGRAAERSGGAEALLGRIRREVFPGVWRDPVCSLLYSPATERLAVVAPYNVVERLASFLAEIP